MPTYSEAIGAYVAAQNATNDLIDAAIEGLTGDVKFLNDTITQLQNSPGQITPADQGLLDSLQSRAQTIQGKLAALDAITPPAPPAA